MSQCSISQEYNDSKFSDFIFVNFIMVLCFKILYFSGLQWFCVLYSAFLNLLLLCHLSIFNFLKAVYPIYCCSMFHYTVFSVSTVAFCYTVLFSLICMLRYYCFVCYVITYLQNIFYNSPFLIL